MTIATHPIQLIDGSDIELWIGALIPPNRPNGNLGGDGILEINDEPELIPVAGATEISLQATKNNQAYRILNDDGWEQSKVTSRNFSGSLKAYFIKSVDSLDPALEPSCQIIKNAALGKENEIYLKIKKFLGIYLESNVYYTRYSVEAGTCKIGDYNEAMPANGLIEVTVGLIGQGKLLTGLQSEAYEDPIIITYFASANAYNQNISLNTLLSSVEIHSISLNSILNTAELDKVLMQ